jgi:hypothetical protein
VTYAEAMTAVMIRWGGIVATNYYYGSLVDKQRTLEALEQIVAVGVDLAEFVDPVTESGYEFAGTDADAQRFEYLACPITLLDGTVQQWVSMPQSSLGDVIKMVLATKPIADVVAERLANR